MVRSLLCIALAVATAAAFEPAVFVAAGASTASAARAAELTGEVVAELRFTEKRTDTGAVGLPGPFAVLPGRDEIAIVAPQSSQILVMRGDALLRRLPFAGPPADDLCATDDWLVAGRAVRPPASQTVELLVFPAGEVGEATKVKSSNPYLRRRNEPGARLWRVVVEDDVAGVFHPNAAATYPLWAAGEGPIASVDQLSRSRAGVGWQRAGWVPNPDGSVDRKVRGRAVPFWDAGADEYLAPLGDVGILLLAPTPEDPPGGDRELPALAWNVRLVHEDGRALDWKLRARAKAPAKDAAPYAVTGRPVTVHGDRLYWLALSDGTVEVRSAPWHFGASE